MPMRRFTPPNGICVTGQKSVRRRTWTGSPGDSGQRHHSAVADFLRRRPGIRKTGIGIILPKVRLDHTPTVTTLSGDKRRRSLQALSDERNLALNRQGYSRDPRLFHRDAVTRCGQEDSGAFRSHRRGTGIHLPGPKRSLQPQYLPGEVFLPGSGYREAMWWKTISSRPTSRSPPWRSRTERTGWSRSSGTTPG